MIVTPDYLINYSSHNLTVVCLFDITYLSQYLKSYVSYVTTGEGGRPLRREGSIKNSVVTVQTVDVELGTEETDER